MDSQKQQNLENSGIFSNCSEKSPPSRITHLNSTSYNSEDEINKFSGQKWKEYTTETLIEVIIKVVPKGKDNKSRGSIRRLERRKEDTADKTLRMITAEAGLAQL